MNANEKNDEEFSDSFTKVLNRHGYSFQYSVLRKAFELKSNGRSNFTFEASEFPVEVQGTNTRIDFILRRDYYSFANVCLFLLIAECKRANPALSNWCFVKAPYTYRSWGNIERLLTESLTHNYDSSIDSLTQQSFVIDDPYHIGFEVRSDQKGDSSGESGQAIEKAASQVLRGVNGFVKTMQKENPLWENYKSVNFLPVIFTTANLFVSDVDVSSADLKTGNLKVSDEQIKPVDWLYYQYPMSVGLKHSLDSLNESADISSLLMNDYLRTILVVSSTGIENFLYKASTFNFVM